MRDLTPEQAASILRKYALLGVEGPAHVRRVAEDAVANGAAIVVPKPDPSNLLGYGPKEES